VFRVGNIATPGPSWWGKSLLPLELCLSTLSTPMSNYKHLSATKIRFGRSGVSRRLDTIIGIRWILLTAQW
jgi:hypothetical protein